MAEIDLSSGGVAYLADMRASRDRPAVLKTSLTILRSSLPTALIFVFEGIDDKSIYYSWLSRINPALSYEPFPCNGKAQVLTLVEMLERDLNGLINGVYVFVDRDFDDLRGRHPSSIIFMTDRYSVENYLVSEDVLDEVLKNEFHCHARPALRAPLLQLFGSLYTDFLSQTREANRRLFIARRLCIKLLAPLPEKVSRIAKIGVNKISPGDSALELIVRMEREPDESEVAELILEFNALGPRSRFRGKFALMFFFAWLNSLSEDRNSLTTQFFIDVGNNNKVNCSAITLGGLAAKSQLPVGLPEFVKNIKPV